MTTPSRTLFSLGAIGSIIEDIQRALVATGRPVKVVDGIYAQETFDAVEDFQRKSLLRVAGIVDEATWSALMHRPVPAVGDRCLQLTAAFEGHGFQLAVGNFDGAFLTWGIVGFTLKSGEVAEIVKAIHAAHPDLVSQAFGANAAELLTLIDSAREVQKQWADAHTLPNKSLAQPWRSMFATFGSFPEVQAEQIQHVHADYLAPAIKTARKLAFSSELGLALCFDIHVQNGGIKPAAMKLLQQQFHPGMTELDRRKLTANAAADSASKTYREDVRARKLAVATGEGTVHAHHYILNHWGLSADFPAAELTQPETSGRRKANSNAPS